MSAKIQQQHAKSKRRIERRLDKTKFKDSSPVLSGTNIHYEVSERTRAISAGGLGMIHTMVGRLGLAEAINRSVNLLKIYLPYSKIVGCVVVAKSGALQASNALTPVRP